MIWFYLTDKSSHICLDSFPLDNTVHTVELIKPDKNINEVNAETHRDSAFHSGAFNRSASFSLQELPLASFKLMFYPNYFLIFKPNRETRHSVTVVLIPNLHTFSTISLIIIKVKWFRYRRGVAQRVGRGIALFLHDCGTRRGWVVSSTPRPHFTPGKDPVPILQEAGWARGPVWTGGKSRPHTDSIPDRPDRTQSLYRLSYPVHLSLLLPNPNSLFIAKVGPCLPNSK